MKMKRLVIDGNKVYTVDEACMKDKKLTLAQIRRQEAGQLQEQHNQTHGHDTNNSDR